MLLGYYYYLLKTKSLKHMKANSFYANSVSEIKLKIEEISSTHFKPNLAIVFASIKHDLQELSKLFYNLNIDLIGCSSSGEIINETITDEGISILVLDMNKDYYKILHQKIEEENNYDNLKSFGSEIVNSFENPAVIMLTGGISLDGEKIVNQIKQSKSIDFPIYGGLAGDDLKLENTFSFSNSWMTENGVVALVINNNKIKVQGKCVSGWEEMGGKHQITKSKGNVLFEIDHKPALDVYHRYFEFHTDFQRSGSENAETYQSIISQYPLIIDRTSEYTIMRSPLISDFENNAIILAGSVNEGEYFQFGIAPDFELLEKTTEAFENLKSEIPKIDAAIVINCKSRQTAFGPEIMEEIEAIHKLWDAPSIGFFSYGEIGNVENGPCEFHNVTCTLATLTEIY